METFAGGRNVMLATGGAKESPSKRNPNLHWIFSTSLTERELSEVGKGKKPNRPARLIIICRQEQKKGTGLVIESLPLILRKFPTITLDVVGDGSALPEFKDLARRLGLRDHVRFYGKLDQTGVRKLLKQADVFCYPSTSSEGFPKVVLEALAYGLPVITTKVSVLPLLLARGGGRLIDVPAANVVAKNVIELLSDPNAYQEMSSQAIDIAKQYSLERWRNTIRDLLRGAWGAPLRVDV
jgi:glycosyltransferase involved in cell wall biosynthesis